MVEQQPGDTNSNLPKGDFNRATSQQLRQARQLLDEISGSLRRADESITNVEFIAGELPLAIRNLENRIKELGGEEQQSVVPTRERSPETQLESEPPKKAPSFQQEDWDLER